MKKFPYFDSVSKSLHLHADLVINLMSRDVQVGLPPASYNASYLIYFDLRKDGEVTSNKLYVTDFGSLAVKLPGERYINLIDSGKDELMEFLENKCEVHGARSEVDRKQKIANAHADNNNLDFCQKRLETTEQEIKNARLQREAYFEKYSQQCREKIQEIADEIEARQSLRSKTPCIRQLFTTPTNSPERAKSAPLRIGVSLSPEGEIQGYYV